MAQTQPPFKLALAALFLDGKMRTADEAVEDLSPEYSGAAFFSKKFTALQLQSLKAVGILSVNDDGAYSLTAYGEENVRKNL